MKQSGNYEKLNFDEIATLSAKALADLTHDDVIELLLENRDKRTLFRSAAERFFKDFCSMLGQYLIFVIAMYF